MRVVLFFLFFTQPIYADHVTLSTSHAPIGVMRDHSHKKDEFMLSYRYANSTMNEILSGSTKSNSNQVLSNYMNSPLKMNMEMHMLGMMYGISDSSTLGIMIPFVKKSMESINMMGRTSKIFNEGVGDISVSNITDINLSNKSNLVLSYGVKLPTGKVNYRKATQTNSNMKLGYGMQLGSGTFDPTISMTFIKQFNKHKLGLQNNSIIRFYKNYLNYNLGNEHSISSWASYSILDSLSFSYRLIYEIKEGINGIDSDLMQNMSPATNPHSTKRKDLSQSFGINFINHSNFLKNHRLALEYIKPIKQNVSDFQLSKKSKIMLGWQYSF